MTKKNPSTERAAGSAAPSTDPRDHSAHRVLLTGGGTGGHVYPCLAIYQLLKREGLVGEALYLGVRGRAEEQIVPRHGIPLRFVPSAPFAGTSILSKMLALLVTLRGALVAGVRILRFRPALVVAAGGYVSAPVILAAFILKPLLRLKIVVDEQNLVPGLLNKFASLFADVVLISFKETAYFIWNNRCVATGYPVRAEYLEPCDDRQAVKRKLDLPEEAFLILVSGGSMGARSINRAVAEMIPALTENRKVVIVHSIGMARGPAYHAVEDTQQRLAKALGSDFDSASLTAVRDGRVIYRGYPYLDNLCDYQKAADLVISRSGAGSLAEILALGKASILIPKRGLPGNHQEMNAISVAEKGAAAVFFERQDHKSGKDFLLIGRLTRLIFELCADPARLAELETGAHGLAVRDADQRISETVRNLYAGEMNDFVPQNVEPRSVRFQRSFDSLVAYLDRVSRDESPEAELYRRYYGIKLEESLDSSDFLEVNKSIKLIGALRRKDLYPFIHENFSSFRGYLKRNALAALRKADGYEPFFSELILAGLGDGYYEVRAEAVALYRRFSEQIADRPEIHQKIVQLAGEGLGGWEVRAEAIKAAALFLDQKEFLEFAGSFRAARNVRAREAVLEAISEGLRRDAFDDVAALRLFVKRMLITTSEFTPHFRVRGRYVRVVEQLERMK